MSRCWILPQPPQWLIPQYNFCRILVANRCVLEAWRRDYTQCWTTLPLTCTSTQKQSSMDSSSVKLLVPLEWEEICSQLAEDQLQKAGEKAGFGCLKCSGDIFCLSVLNTWITKGCRINKHSTPFSSSSLLGIPSQPAYLLLMSPCRSFGLYIHKFYHKSFLLPADISIVLYRSVLTWNRMRGWN